jgi:hypothetical protein
MAAKKKATPTVLQEGDVLRCYIWLDLRWMTEDGIRTRYWEPNWDMVYGPTPVVSAVKISSTGQVWYDIRHHDFLLNGRMDHGRIVCASANLIAIFDEWSTS